MVAYKSFKAKEKSSWVIPKVVAVAYESFSMQSLSHNSNGVSQRRSSLELVVYESGRKESFDCKQNDTSGLLVVGVFLFLDFSFLATVEAGNFISIAPTYHSLCKLTFNIFSVCIPIYS